MFAYHCIVTYLASCFLPFPTEILRVGTDYGTLVNSYVAAKRRAMDNACVGHDFTTVTDHCIAVNESERMNGHILSYFRLRVDIS